MSSPASRSVRSVPRSGDAAERPLVLNAILAAVLSVASSLAVCMAIALLGWFFSDSGAHGNTVDALRVGAVAWVVGLGESLQTAIGQIGATPLGLTALVLVAVVRSARWGWCRSTVPASLSPGLVAALAGAFVGTFVLIAVVFAQVVAPASASPSVVGTFRGALLISAVGGGWGVLVESGYVQVLWRRAPELARAVADIAVRATLTLAALAAVLVAVSLACSLNDAAATYSALKLGFGDALMLTVVCALSLPNMVGLALAYVVGPGFAVGTGTSVTVTSVSLGALPLFPVVAALPDPGHQSGWLVLLLFVPGLCALAAAARRQRDCAPDGWDQILLRGLLGGAVAGLVIAIFAVVSGGALGDHRMSQIGADLWPVLLFAVGGMGLGGALGSVSTAAWQRWRDH